VDLEALGDLAVDRAEELQESMWRWRGRHVRSRRR
jgi:hypothetical protein